jgi:hypothetical protein
VLNVAGVYTITIDPDDLFGVASLIRVRVTALDTEGNPARLS